MIIDTSTIIAILDREPGYERLRRRLAEDVAGTKIGVPTRLETGMVLTARLGARGNTVLSRFLQRNSIETLPFTDAMPKWLSLRSTGSVRDGTGQAELR